MLSNNGRIFSSLVLFLLIQIVQSKSLKRFDECEKFYTLNDCYYFPCLDAHYSCGRDNHLARFSYELCLLTTKKYSSQLTKTGQLYFNHTHQCVMMSLHEQLIEEHISEKFTCSHLQTLIFNIYLNCLQSTQQETKMVTIIDFCSVVCDNMQTMIDMFLNLDDLYINLHQLLSRSGKSCGAEVNEDLVHTVPSLLMSVCLDRKNVRLKDDITNIMFNQRFEPSEYEWI